MTLNAVVNITGYQFVDVSQYNASLVRSRLQAILKKLFLRGTILFSGEGINISLAGNRDSIEHFKKELKWLLPNTEVPFQETFSSYQPFKQALVKVKRQIVPCDTEIDLANHQTTGVYLEPETLNLWLTEQGDPELQLLDVRNRYEFERGSFLNAKQLSLKQFGDFPEALSHFSEIDKQKRTVTFCTGGIRCDKASAIMIQQGFTQVFQLKGGILSYFKRCGNTHYRGGCFVFDERSVISHDS